MPEPEIKADAKLDEKRYPLNLDREPVTTNHKIDGMKYSVTVGMLPINDEFGEAEAAMFYMAYTRTDVDASVPRPLMFSFNGGPGSSSVWLHLGALGPKRVRMETEGQMPSPPFELVDNPHTWLGDTDLVFIDPVGTGYSRPAKQDGGKKFWSLKGDIESIGEFIRLYLSRSKRWTSPLYLVGESYGTTRATGVAGHLVEKGIAFNGIVLVSSILNFQTARFNKGNDLPYPLFLPTYTATAWYHGKLKAEWSLADALRAAEEFCASEYLVALAKGDELKGEARAAVAAKISELTGLSATHVDDTDLRIYIQRFCKELLRDERRTVGRLDSRFKGIDANSATDEPEHDPAMTEILPPYTSMINDYLARTLGWESDSPYYVFNPGELWKHWDWGGAGEGHPDTSEALRATLSKNRHMRVFIASGYYDLATPYYATEYTLKHLGLDASLRSNITTGYYEAGHMMYIHEGCLKKLKSDVSQFLAG